MQHALVVSKELGRTPDPRFSAKLERVSRALAVAYEVLDNYQPAPDDTDAHALLDYLRNQWFACSTMLLESKFLDRSGSIKDIDELNIAIDQAGILASHITMTLSGAGEPTLSGE